MQQATITGTVSDLFNHRFAVSTENGKYLADLGKHNTEAVTLKIGDRVEVSGEQKPSELKVLKLILNGREVSLESKHEKDKAVKHGSAKVDANPQVAIDAATKAGLNHLQEPIRKPKHFEITGTDQDGQTVELHIEFDGIIRKTRTLPEKTVG